MKQFITLKPMQTGGYYVVETVDSKFYLTYSILDFHFYQKCFSSENLIEWLYDKKRTCTGNQFFDISKKDHIIALYDISHALNAEDENAYYPTVNSMLDENKRFDMSYKNFEEILLHWEELRVSMPDIILLVIHEDNHVTLETDPKIIKEYQDAGYAFNIDKQ